MALLDLSNELLGHILSQIPVDIHYPNTIYHVMLTCRRLSAIAMPLLYSRLTFNFPQTAGRMVINSPNPFRDYDNMLSLHPERASWALSASFTYSRNRPDVWDHIANILPKLSLLQSLEIGAGLGHPDPFGEYVGLAVPGRWTFDEDRNFIRLLKQCDHLRSLHTVVVMDRYITLREAWAFFALPHIRVLDMKILNEITAPPDEDDISQEPSKLSAFNLTADMLPNTYAAKHLFRGLSALKELYWSAEHPQPHYSFQHALEIWCPKTIEEAIFPCKSTLSQLQLYNNLTLQHIILPHIEFLEFSVLSVLKISGRILFANASTAPYCNRMNDRDDFVKRLPRNLEQLEIRFHEGENALNIKPKESEGYKWLLELPRCKSIYCPGLKKVAIVEELELESPQQKMKDCPEDVRGAFFAADIVLDMISRTLPGKLFGIYTTNLPA